MPVLPCTDLKVVYVSKADAGLLDTYTGANNNVMRGHDPRTYP